MTNTYHVFCDHFQKEFLAHYRLSVLLVRWLDSSLGNFWDGWSFIIEGALVNLIILLSFIFHFVVVIVSISIRNRAKLRHWSFANLQTHDLISWRNKLSKVFDLLLHILIHNLVSDTVSDDLRLRDLAKWRPFRCLGWWMSVFFFRA